MLRELSIHQTQNNIAFEMINLIIMGDPDLFNNPIFFLFMRPMHQLLVPTSYLYEIQ